MTPETARLLTSMWELVDILGKQIADLEMELESEKANSARLREVIGCGCSGEVH